MLHSRICCQRAADHPLHSTGYTLRPGDVIVAGTPGALPLKLDDVDGRIDRQYGPIKVPGIVHLKPGDTVEVEVTGLAF